MRKAAAQLLENLAINYIKQIVPFILQKSDQVFLSDSKWQAKEAVILAIGAIAKGSNDEMDPYLTKFVPVLLHMLSSEEKLVRSISCWTLSRYSAWISKNDECLCSYIECMIRCLYDAQCVVKIAACTSLSYYIRGSSSSFCKYLPTIMKVLK